MKKYEHHPSLPLVCNGRDVGSKSRVVKTVRGLGDINILKFHLLIWSERDYYADGYREIRTSTSEDFSGIESNSHRGDLLKLLGHVLARLDRGEDTFNSTSQISTESIWSGGGFSTRYSGRHC